MPLLSALLAPRNEGRRAVHDQRPLITVIAVLTLAISGFVTQCGQSSMAGIADDGDVSLSHTVVGDGKDDEFCRRRDRLI